jgi:phage shock protein A
MSSILRANVNDLLDHAEDPEKMLNQIIRDMEDALRQADSQVAEQIAQQKMIQNDLDNAKKQADEWNKKAELAVSKGADDLAREALRRVNDYQAQATVFQKQLDAQTHAVQELKSKRDQLESKYQDAKRNRDTLIARAKRAQAQQQVTKAAAKISSVDYASDLAHMERRIQEMEARAAAGSEVAEEKASVEEKIAKLAEDDAVEQQLAALKQKMGK